MKTSIFVWFTILSLAAVNGLAQTPAADPSAAAPKIQFQTMAYDFGKLSSGQAARHDFIFTNVGTGVLEITGVKPACGCTAAGEWSKTVEPGKAGMIPLQFNSAGFSGMVVKTATVTCNDPVQPSVTLQLSGNVWKEIEAPQYLMLNGSTESVADAKASAKIVNNGDMPLVITGMEVNNAMFVADLKTNQPGKEFEIFVKVVPPLNLNMPHGIITLKTSSTNVPQVQVTAMLALQAVVSVTPPQISLPPPPLANGFVQAVTIRNIGTNVVKLSEPTVNDLRVSAAVKETEPGKTFSVEVTIPQGYEAKQGQTTELVVKSSHPSYPELKIPILQALPTPVPTAATPTAAVPAHVH